MQTHDVIDMRPASIKHCACDVMVKPLYIRKNALIFEIGVMVKITINHRKTLSNHEQYFRKVIIKLFSITNLKGFLKLKFFD